MELAISKMLQEFLINMRNRNARFLHTRCLGMGMLLECLLEMFPDGRGGGGFYAFRRPGFRPFGSLLQGFPDLRVRHLAVGFLGNTIAIRFHFVSFLVLVLPGAGIDQELEGFGTRKCFGRRRNGPFVAEKK